MDQPLVYPYVPDYHVAMLVGAGSSFHFSLFVPGTLLSASFVFLLFFLAARLSGSCYCSLDARYRAVAALSATFPIGFPLHFLRLHRTACCAWIVRA